MKIVLFTVCGLFLIAALWQQFRHDFMSISSRRAKATQLESEWWLANTPRDSHYSQALSERIASEGKRLRAEARGETVVWEGDILLEHWVKEQKENGQPLALFLYGGAILFLFGGMMKNSSHLPVASQDSGCVNDINTKE